MNSLQSIAAVSMMAVVLLAAISESASADLSRRDVRRIVTQELRTLPINPPGAPGVPPGPPSAQAPAIRYARISFDGAVETNGPGLSNGITQANVTPGDFLIPDDTESPSSYCIHGFEVHGAQVTRALFDPNNGGIPAVAKVDINYGTPNAEECRLIIRFMSLEGEFLTPSSFFLLVY
jgi:hypothetical protein